jgi:chromosome partitioning protein
MRTIAVSNQKGGSGKTTTVVNLAAALGERKSRVLVVDLDSQHNASTWLAVHDGDRGLLDVFLGKGNLSSLVRQTNVSGVDVVPSSSWLMGAEKALAGEVGAETILRRQVERLPRDRWDYLLLDCPPALGTVTVNALAAAREVLVPVEAHVMALSGLAQLRTTVEAIRERLNPELEITGILACRVDWRTRHAADVVEELRRQFGKKVFRTVIRENVRLAEAPSFGNPITQYAPDSHGAEDYRALARELASQERRTRNETNYR